MSCLSHADSCKKHGTEPRPFDDSMTSRSCDVAMNGTVKFQVQQAKPQRCSWSCWNLSSLERCHAELRPPGLCHGIPPRRQELLWAACGNGLRKLGMWCQRPGDSITHIPASKVTEHREAPIACSAQLVFGDLTISHPCCPTGAHTTLQAYPVEERCHEHVLHCSVRRASRVEV